VWSFTYSVLVKLKINDDNDHDKLKISTFFVCWFESDPTPGIGWWVGCNNAMPIFLSV